MPLCYALHRSATVTIFVVLALYGCDAGTAATSPATAPATTAPTMNFTVEEVFYIKPPVDRVILVGTINEGTVHVGDKLVVHTSAGPIDVGVDNIESIQQGDLKPASKGQQVGLRLYRHQKRSAIQRRSRHGSRRGITRRFSGPGRRVSFVWFESRRGPAGPLIGLTLSRFRSA